MRNRLDLRRGLTRAARIGSQSVLRAWVRRTPRRATLGTCSRSSIGIPGSVYSGRCASPAPSAGLRPLACCRARGWLRARACCYPTRCGACTPSECASRSTSSSSTPVCGSWPSPRRSGRAGSRGIFRGGISSSWQLARRGPSGLCRDGRWRCASPGDAKRPNLHSVHTFSARPLTRRVEAVAQRVCTCLRCRPAPGGPARTESLQEGARHVRTPADRRG